MANQNDVYGILDSVTANITNVGKKAQVDANICEQFVEFTLNNKVEAFKFFSRALRARRHYQRIIRTIYDCAMIASMGCCNR